MKETWIYMNWFNDRLDAYTVTREPAWPLPPRHPYWVHARRVEERRWGWSWRLPRKWRY